MSITKSKIWNISKSNRAIQSILSQRLGISKIVAQILINRGITTSEEGRLFLQKDLADLHNPYLFKDMGIAVELIFEKVTLKEKILVYGDYDVDGITSTSVLVSVLKEIGAEVEFHIPDRKTEGYGLNIGALEKAMEKNIKLIITVDCGISAIAEALYLKEQNIDLIITDHHEPGEELPEARAIINPKMEDSGYPCDFLAGVGVAFKLSQALLARKNPKLPIAHLGKQYLDLVALGTVADIVPLKGENRVIVEHGLKIINDRNRIGLKALIDVAGLEDKEITAGHLGFGLAPRLNAVGRLSNASIGVELLLTASEIKAKELATYLNQENVDRQAIENDITQEAIAMIENSYDLKNNKVIVLASENWHAGVIGIVASRIVDKYYRPTILLAIEGESAKGSCRSIRGLDMFQALNACQEYLQKFGGHKQAAGLSLKTANIHSFIREINAFAKMMLKEEDLIPRVEIDGEVSFSEITEELIGELKTLEPFGFKNPGPTLICRNTRILEHKEVGKSGGHLKLKIQSEHFNLDAIGFNLADRIDMLNPLEPFDFAFALEKNEFRGKTTLQLNIKDFKESQVEDNPYLCSGADELSFVEGLFSKAEECLEDDYYRNIGEKVEFYTKVVGVSFEGRQSLIASLKEGQELILKREPKNLYDQWAIKVETQEGIQVGYLNAKLAKNLAPVLDKGTNYYVLVSGITGGNDRNYGLNIIIQKITEAFHEKRSQELLEKRNLLQGLTDKELKDRIRERLVGPYPYRPKQKEAIEALEEGNNTLAIFGTGRGKSAVFQATAAYLALQRGLISIIIYPLRALVNDQYVGMEKKLGELGLRVFKANGSISDLERIRLFNALEKGEVDIVLTTPEFIEYHLEKFQILKEKIGFFVVDESHHIGDSNRPAYKRLSKLLKNIGKPLTLAVTATANDETAETIIETLDITKVIVDPFVRENLQIIDKRDFGDKNGYIKRIVQSGEKTIIYVNSRSKTIELANYLGSELPKLKDQIIFYNAGLNNEERMTVEDMFRKGQLTTVVSTSAFGEGIDIPDVKHVVVYHLNFNFTEFNQQSGRAGRDGGKATIHLLCGKRDVRINDFILEATAPDRELLVKFYLVLKKLASSEQIIQKTNSELAELLQKEIGKEVRDNTISISLGILTELELLEREVEGRERRIILLPPPKIKKELEASLKYQEGLQEKHEFQEFQQYLFKAKNEEILELINRPIYPVKFLNNINED